MLNIGYVEAPFGAFLLAEQKFLGISGDYAYLTCGWWSSIVKLDSQSLEALCAPVVNGLGFELWGVEFRSSQKHAHVKVFIDHEDGITVDNCSDVSHQISGVLDVEDPISVPYTLEVSSPGLERPLMKVEHFEKYIDEEVKVRLSWAVEDRKNLNGKLIKVEEDEITILMENQEFEFPISAVKRANLIYSV
ncbi:MAG: ribosome maturation factor RimP [Pseudomonadota bacterium]